MRRALMIAGGLALAGAAIAQPLSPAEPPGPHAQPLPTPDFVLATAQSDEFERQEGRLCAMRAHDPRVRKAGRLMAQAHTRSTQLLTAAARQAGLPSMPPPGLDIGQQQMFERLKATTGVDFDQLYVDQQVSAHERALALMSSYARDGQPGPIRHAAVEIRPAIVRHLAMFRRLQMTVG